MFMHIMAHAAKDDADQNRLVCLSCCIAPVKQLLYADCTTLQPEDIVHDIWRLWRHKFDVSREVIDRYRHFLIGSLNRLFSEILVHTDRHNDWQ